MEKERLINVAKEEYADTFEKFLDYDKWRYTRKIPVSYQDLHLNEDDIKDFDKYAKP